MAYFVVPYSTRRTMDVKKQKDTNRQRGAHFWVYIVLNTQCSFEYCRLGHREANVSCPLHSPTHIKPQYCESNNSYRYLTYLKSRVFSK